MIAEIVLSAGTDRVAVREIPKLFADAICPAAPNVNADSDANDMRYMAVFDEWEANVEHSAQSGELTPRNNMTLLPRPGAAGDELLRCFVTVDDLTRFAAGFDIVVRVDEAVPTQGADKGDEGSSAIIWTPEKIEQLRNEHSALVAEGNNRPTKTLAKKYGVSDTRIRELKAVEEGKPTKKEADAWYTLTPKG